MNSLLPRIDENGHIDLETSMRLAIPRNRIQHFVDWGATLTKYMTFDLGISRWCNSVPIRITTWHDIIHTPTLPNAPLLAPMPWQWNAMQLRVQSRAVNPQFNLTNPSVPMWCHMVFDGTNGHADPRYHVCDNALTWYMHSSFDDWDVEQLVTYFDQFISQLECMATHNRTDRKRKREGFQEWSPMDAQIARRTQCPMAMLVCIMFLVHAVTPSVDDPVVIVFPTDGVNVANTVVVVLDPTVIASI